MNVDFLRVYKNRVNQVLEKVLPKAEETPPRLHQAMRYAVLNGGKRIRPALVYATAELFKINAEMLDMVACAVELIHSYSLVHDDLPTLDNDILRRGKPTCHIAFDEATAILVGDALQSLAFQCLAVTNLKVVKALAFASGSKGMVGGQVIDFMNTGKIMDLNALQQMHNLKTGALISAAVQMSFECEKSVSEQEKAALLSYANNLGLAFQVCDDILDVESSTEILGKTPGKDVEQNKNSFPSLLGLEKSKKYADELCENAIAALNIFDEKADNLRMIAEFTVKRVA